jgi:hypothetical protein
MGRWDEAKNLIEKLWGKGEIEVAMEELRAANSSEGQDEDITWSELIQAPYFKGSNLRSRNCTSASVSVCNFLIGACWTLVHCQVVENVNMSTWFADSIKCDGWGLNAVAAIGSALFALQQFAGINGVLYFSSLTFKDAGITNGVAASAAVGVANLVGQ